MFTFYFRSNSSGNCLYSSVSLALVGDNTWVTNLRILTSIELFLHADFYGKHPCILSVSSSHDDMFSSVNNIFKLCLSHATVDLDLSSDNASVKAEAIHNCFDKRWCSFICILALSSVVNKTIFTFYPDFGDVKYKLLFTQEVKPRLGSSKGVVNILFCKDGPLESSVTFTPNHFVPLVPISRISKKRKSCSNGVPVTIKKRQLSFIETNNPEKSCQSKLSDFFSSSKSTFEIEVNSVPNISVDKPITNLTGSTFPSVDTSCSSTLTLPTNITEYDVCTYSEKVANCNEEQLLNLIKNVYVPDKKYNFQKNNHRSFRLEWLNTYSWLAYSPTLDGAFCLPCVLFGSKFKAKCYKVKNLFTEALTYWPNAKSLFNKHQNAEAGLHVDSMYLLNNLMHKTSGKSQSVDQLLNKQVSENIVENRKKLIPIIDTIKLCGRLGLSLRGHRDDSIYHPDVGCYSAGGVGNFVELLNYRVRGGDTNLGDHLRKHKNNASYISKSTQNDLIKCCGDFITDSIISEVKQSKYFSILADEAADCSNKEQMSLVLRYVDEKNNIREDFVQFIHCDEGLSGSDLSEVLLKKISFFGLDINNCRGQGYDGAGAVAGKRKGLSAHILRLNEKAIYTHCHSHRLNLCISKSCSIQSVRNVLEQIKKYLIFLISHNKDNKC